jgi:hypothetical protein
MSDVSLTTVVDDALSTVSEETSSALTSLRGRKPA